VVDGGQVEGRLARADLRRADLGLRAGGEGWLARAGWRGQIGEDRLTKGRLARAD